MDFTITRYQELLEKLLNKGYSFISYSDYIEGVCPQRFVILRHDVDLLPQNSLEFAKIQEKRGIRGTYYFRIVKESWDEGIIKKIEVFGHEIGYHYEDMDLVNGSDDNNLSSRSAEAIQSFEKHIKQFRVISNIKTICMHGSPKSSYDNKDLWNTYNYKDYGIIGEPYLDSDFNSLFYLTDTGRRWDGWKVSIRDKIPQQQDWIKNGLVFHSTKDIIKALDENRLPAQIMITFHPQRWTNNPVLWLKELVLQNMKNVIKGIIIRLRS